MKVMVLGAGGMIGNAMFRVLSASSALEVVGTVRSTSDATFFPRNQRCRIIGEIDVAWPDGLAQVFGAERPGVVVNCIGLTKHVAGGNVPLSAIAMNALLPHRIATLCALFGARLIHISTDCVFSGEKGGYCETDMPDANDVYGRSKYLGEVVAGNAITLRTSTIGHELGTRHGLLEWFLSQNRCKGYTHAIFSGVPSVELARIVADIVIPNPELSGLYHVAGPPIAKADLLRLVGDIYERDVPISLDDSLKIDRSLNAAKFEAATGYRAPPWSEMVRLMYNDFLKGYPQNV